MDEIAEMMLDGTICAGCGELLGGPEDWDDPMGFPQYCGACQPDDFDEVDYPPRRKTKPYRCGTCGKRFREAAHRAQHDRDTGHGPKAEVGS